MANELYDVVIVGGGPAGLAAALTLGRARRRVLLCDAGPRRNAAAEQIHNFVTRDGTPPAEFRRIGRQQLETYPRVQARDERVESIGGGRGEFRVQLSSGMATARRVLLCTGMIDELLPIEGFAELWGHSIFQCPYCHGWEVQERRWGYLAREAHTLDFGLKLRAWTRDVIVFTGGLVEVSDELREGYRKAGVRLETAPVRRLIARDGRLESVALEGASAVPCDVLFAHPEQRQVELVRELGLELDEHGSVRVDPMTRETTRPGIYAAGDLTTKMQWAIGGAAAGGHAAAMISHELTAELAASGLLD
jgi:thioredoxin reductase